MEEDMIYIERKDGIKYYRKSKYKEETCDSHLNIRIKGDTLNSIKEIASRKNVKYQALIKEILDNYINRNKEV